MNTRQVLGRLSRGIGVRLWWFFMLPAMINLAQKKAYQKTTFSLLGDRFNSLYRDLRMSKQSTFTTPFWNEMNLRFEKVFLPKPPFSFLRLPEIHATMYNPYRSPISIAALSYLEHRLPKERLEILLEEDYVGGPALVSSRYRASGSTIFHLHHFMRFAQQVGCDFGEIGTVIDWGGGYGSMARIFDRLATKPYTYVIIDTPLFSCFQWLYLSTILGEERVHLLCNPDDIVQSGKVNLVPLGFLERFEIRGDLFISTWALSESSDVAQDYVVNHRWFGAKHLLLASQKSNTNLPYADRLVSIAKNCGATVEEIGVFPENYYALR